MENIFVFLGLILTIPIAFKGTIVNQALPFLYEGSFEITVSVHLSYKKRFRRLEQGLVS